MYLISIDPDFTEANYRTKLIMCACVHNLDLNRTWALTIRFRGTVRTPNQG